jgi:hypothetical protein
VTGLLEEIWDQRPLVRSLVFQLAALSVFFQVLIWQARGNYVPGPSVGWLDDWSYYQESLVISQWWQGGKYPDLSEAGDPPYLGTLHTAWHRMLAVLAFFGASQPQTFLLIHLPFVALLPLAGFSCGHALARLLKVRLAVHSGLLTALALTLYPVTPYYGCYLLKDLTTGIFGLLTLWAGLMLLQRRPCGWLLLMASLFWLFPLRAYAALAVVGSLAIVLLSRLPLHRALWFGLWGGVGLYILWLSERFGPILEQLFHSLFNNMPQDLATPISVIRHVAAGTLRAFLAPYPWVMAEGQFPNYEIFFGQWFLFLLGYPLALVACFRMIRVNQVGGAFPLLASVLGLSVLILAYGGNITRQRYFIDLWILTLAGPGIVVHEPLRRLIMIGLPSLIGVFAVVQLTRLFLTS